MIILLASDNVHRLVGRTTVQNNILLFLLGRISVSSVGSGVKLVEPEHNVHAHHCLSSAYERDSDNFIASIYQAMRTYI